MCKTRACNVCGKVKNQNIFKIARKKLVKNANIAGG